MINYHSPHIFTVCHIYYGIHILRHSFGLIKIKIVQLKLLIVEDSVSYAIELEQVATKIGFDVIGTVDNSADALDIIFSEHPDIILMDINIKGRLTGIDIAKRIIHLNIPILYITSFNEESTYLEASQSNLIGYIVKPVEKLTLATSLKLLIQNSINNQMAANNAGVITKDDEEYVFLMKNSIFYKFQVSSILFIKSDDNYSSFTLEDGSNFIIRIKLSDVENLLVDRHFVRCHRQYIVNQKKIQSINTIMNTLHVKDHIIPFSRSKKAAIMSIGIFLS